MILTGALVSCVKVSSAFMDGVKKTVKEARRASDLEAQREREQREAKKATEQKTEEVVEVVQDEIPVGNSIEMKNDLDTTINPEKEPLAPLNIKIINNRALYGDTVYYVAHTKDTEWKKPALNAKLHTDERFSELSVENMEDLLKDLCFEIGAGEEKTFIYFVGDDVEFKSLRNICEEEYPNITVFRG